MFGKKDKDTGKTNIILIILCILLLAALGGLFVYNRKERSEERSRLEKLAVKEKVGIEDYEKVKDQAEERLEESDEQSENIEDMESSADPSSDGEAAKDGEEGQNKDDAADASEETADAEAEPEKVYADGVSCWGDDLLKGTESETYSYMTVLQKLLTDNGYDVSVVNKTIQGGGTLSMMKRAGVADDVLQNYITSHKNAANGATLAVTETGIRDFTEEDLVRDDVDCVPVICMGYYGGWNHDPNELAEQQERIVNTFSNPENFIIVGTRPVDGSVSSETLDSALSQIWGEHYISLAAVTPSPASTYEAQAAMAQAVLDKLIELDYISK